MSGQGEKTKKKAKASLSEVEESTVIAALKRDPSQDLDYQAWELESETMDEQASTLLSTLDLEEVFGKSFLTLRELQALFMKHQKKVQEVISKKEFIQMGMILGGLSATGNSATCLKFLTKSEEMKAIWNKMKVLSSGRYDKTNQFNFPLSFYGRLFPAMKDRVGSTMVAPNFVFLQKYLSSACADYTAAVLADYVYPGGPSSIPSLPLNARKLYTVLMTMVSIVIGRRGDGTGNWKDVTLETTMKFMNQTATDGYGLTKPEITKDCTEKFDMVEILSSFCGAGGLYETHPTYGKPK